MSIVEGMQGQGAGSATNEADHCLSANHPKTPSGPGAGIVSSATRAQPNASAVLEQAAAKVSERDAPRTSYPQNSIDGFQQGAMLDLRARIAIDLMKSSYFNNSANCPQVSGEPMSLNADFAAALACNTAAELVREFEARGWIKPVPDNTTLTTELEAQAHRMGRFAAAQQISMHQAGREASGVVAVPPGVAGAPVGRA